MKPLEKSAEQITDQSAADESLRRRARGLATLLEVSKSFAATLDMQQILQLTVEGAAGLVGLDTAAVYTLEGEMLQLRATTPPLEPGFPEHLRVAPLAEHAHIREAIESGEPVYVPDLKDATTTAAEHQVAEQRDLRTTLFVPMVADGQATGAFIVGSIGECAVISDSEIDLCLALANLAAMTVRSAQLYNDSRQRAAELEETLAQRIQAEESRRLSEGRYRTLFEHSPFGIVIADHESYYIDANPAICQMLGYTRDDLVGLHASDIVAESEIEHIEPALEAIQSASGYGRVWRFRRKDGSTFEAEVAATTMPGGQLLGLIRDLTDQRRAEQEKAELETGLQQAQRMQSIGRLAGGVAHDFNNMLSVIIGYTDLALEELDSEDLLHGDLVEVRNAAERSANLSRQLLAFARRQTASPELLALDRVIGETLKMLQHLLGEDIELDWKPGEELALVCMDPAQVDQVLANLCINARDAISGVGRIAIETRNVSLDEAYCAENPDAVPGSYVLLSVSDSGHGMEPETLASIFEPYFTTKKEGGGTGLGLSTVYGIVKQNEGLVEVSSRLGQGTTFRIYLPAHASGKEASRVERSDRVPEGGNETILLVEDEASILELSRRVLESLGYRVLAAPSPAEALDAARAHPREIDLLITDVVMPEMNGRELARRLEEVAPDLRTLFISGYTADVIAERGVLAEGVRLLPKPFTKDQLAAKVRQAIQRNSPD